MIGLGIAGVLAGGIYGAATSDSPFIEDTLARTAGGALAGAGLGLGVSALLKGASHITGISAYKGASAAALRAGATSGEARKEGMSALGSQLWSTGKTIGRGAVAGAKMAYGGGKAALKMGSGAAQFALNHPVAALGISGAGLGIAALNSGGGGNVPLGQLAEQTGVSSTGFDPGQGGDAYQSSKQQFIDSASGELLAGLHRRRHG